MLSDRTKGDDGVIAVLTALLVATVLLPVAALGLTSYVRAGVAGEMQRAADSGALAAATSLLFVDVTQLNLAADGAKVAAGPACPAAAAALGGTSPSREVAPLSAAFAPGTVDCKAFFSPDEAYPQCITELTEDAQAVIDAIDARLTTLLQTVEGLVVDPLTGLLLGGSLSLTQAVADKVEVDLAQRLVLSQKVFALIPASAFDGIGAQLSYAVGGPLDGVLGVEARTPRTATATARRLFKPLVPHSPKLAAALDTAPSLDPDLVAELGKEQLVDSPEAYAVALFQLRINIVREAITASGTELDGVDETRVAPASAFVTATLRETRDRLVALGLPVEVADTLLLPLPVTVNPLDATCRKAAIELFNALTRAVELNHEEQDLTRCLTRQLLLGTPDTAPSCIARLFRAQLRPNPSPVPVVSP